ncbi:transporter [Candidatus Woesearchaeota archaeon CG10_big_fil_rev_8_21_14_0_10_34_8]|nr:MAG: transporter [Candidatus Woesearchaeota archaeon CG10_big_fil_rev_8_21_14_0_10_34_8]
MELKTYKYLDFITGLFVAVLLISNTASVKILNFGPFTFDGGTLLFPLTYIFGDILTEVYGYKRSRRVIWIGFFCVILMALVYAIVGFLPSAADWGMQDAYMSILGIVPRIVLASLIAYFAGEFSNSFILAKMKIWTKGKWLWTRTIGSTIVGEGVDTLLFVVIAFAGLMPNSLLIAIIISNYVFKVLMEAILTPVTYAVVNFLKKKEHEDHYDYQTNFNPFSGK